MTGLSRVLVAAASALIVLAAVLPGAGAAAEPVAPVPSAEPVTPSAEPVTPSAEPVSPSVEPAEPEPEPLPTASGEPKPPDDRESDRGTTPEDAGRRSPVAPETTVRDARPSGSMTGRVTDPEGAPVGGVLVTTIPAYETAVTASDGVYAFDSLPTGSYDLHLRTTDGAFIAAYLGGGDSPAPNPPVVVNEAQTTSVPTEVMQRAAFLVGTVKHVGSGSPATGRATVWRRTADGDGTPTFAKVSEFPVDGTYSQGGFRPGTYTVCFDSLSFVAECFRNKATLTEATSFALNSSHPTIVNADVVPLVIIGFPYLSGDRAVGSTLVLHHRKRPGITFTYEWYVDGVLVPGAVGYKFPLTSAHHRKTVRVKVTGKRPGYRTAVRWTDVTAPIMRAPVPTLSGVTALNAPSSDRSGWRGGLLTVRPGTWSAEATLSYEWFADGRVIEGAVGPTYRLTPSDRGKRLSVQVTGTEGWHWVSRTSSETPKVATLGTAALEGDISADGAVSVRRSGVYSSGGVAHYVFYAGRNVVQSGSSSVLRGLDRFVGQRLQARVVIANPGYATHTQWTNITAPVAP